VLSRTWNQAAPVQFYRSATAATKESSVPRSAVVGSGVEALHRNQEAQWTQRGDGRLAFREIPQKKMIMEGSNGLWRGMAAGGLSLVVVGGVGLPVSICVADNSSTRADTMMDLLPASVQGQLHPYWWWTWGLDREPGSPFSVSSFRATSPQGLNTRRAENKTRRPVSEPPRNHDLSSYDRPRFLDR
jgi:hypothetical protein